MANVQEKSIVVIGAGVVGLTTAIKIQESGGYRVSIIAETFPGDPKTIRYTSHWAGAHHVAGAGDERRKKMERETFEVMWDLSAPGGAAEGCFLRIPQTEYFCYEVEKPYILEFMPDFAYLTEDKFLPGTKSGVTFSTVTIDIPVYLNYLLARFLSKGGIIVRGGLQHINQVLEGGVQAFTAPPRTPVPPDAVIVCAGLGARSLGGVEDKKMYPIRGQTVLLRAPWIKFGRTMSSKEGLWTYTIPRRSGDVIVGGIRHANDWYPSPRKEITEDILKRALELCPELAPADVRAQREPTVDDLRPLIIEEGCGLRPAREGEVRLEVEWFERPHGEGKVPVVYNYGHGAYGYQSSWGSASIALYLLKGVVSETK